MGRFAHVARKECAGVPCTLPAACLKQLNTREPFPAQGSLWRRLLVCTRMPGMAAGGHGRRKVVVMGGDPLIIPTPSMCH